MKSFSIVVSIATALILWCSLASAVSHQDYTFQLSPASRELSQQTVRGIFEDTSGFVWFLTQEGLNRFDGYEVIRFRASSSNEKSLSHQSITAMVEDSRGDFWITTAGGGLNRLRAKNFTFESFKYEGQVNQSSPISNVIMSAMISTAGQIWLGYGQGVGYSIFDPDTREFQHFRDSDVQSLGIVRDFSETADGTIWMAVEDKGLYKVDPEHPERPERVHIRSKTRPQLEVMKFTKLLVDQDGRLWVTTLSDGLIGVDPGSGTLRYLSHELQSPSAGALESYVAVEDEKGNIWVGTTNGIQVINSDKRMLTTIDTTNSNLPDDQIFSLFQSKSGVTWVGTYNGLAYGTQSLFERYSEQDGLSSASTNAFAQTEDGIIWVANDAGIDAISTAQERDSNYPLNISRSPFDLPTNRIMSLLADGNNLWAGTLNSGLFEIDREQQEITHYQRMTGSENGISANGITSLLKVDETTLLIGTYGGGLNEFNTETKRFSNYVTDSNDKSTISNNMVVALYMDSFGIIWVGTEKGINRFNISSKEFTRFESDIGNPNSLSSDMAWAINEDSKGDLWIGTQSGGVHRWRKEYRSDGIGVFEQHSADIGLPSADVYSIANHGDKLWLSHNRGITKLDIDDLSTTSFDITDGLQGPEFNHGAAFKDKAGYIYFGGPNGFNRINPNLAEKSNLDPPVRLTSIKILNKDRFFDTPYSSLEDVVLNYNFDFISFTFASLDYKNPTSNSYRYMLKGLNQEWIDLGSTRQISFTRLPPGNYELIVQGSNSDGVWSDKKRTLALIVKPPFWLTWWAYISYALLVSLVLAYLIRLQKQKSLREENRRKELEDKVRERTEDLQQARVAAENATKAKSEFLAAMSHEIRTPMHGMLGMTDLLMQTKLTEQQIQFAKSAKASGESLLTLVNAILDFSKIEAKKVELESIEFDLRRSVEDTCYLQRETASQKGIDFNLRISPEIKHLYLGDPNKFRQIITNLIGNAIKFTDQGYVFVKVDAKHSGRDDKSTIRIEIIDTGIGIDHQTQERIFESFTQADTSTTRQYGGTGLGLTISKELVTLMGGDINIESELGVGTKFTIEIPLMRGSPIDHPPVINANCVTVAVASEGLASSITSVLDYFSVRYSSVLKLEELPDQPEEKSLVLIEYDLAMQEMDLAISKLRDASIIFLSDYPSMEISGEIHPWSNLLKPITSDSFYSAYKELFFVKPKLEVAPVEEGHLEAADGSAIRLKVLIVEDVEVNQRIAGTMLEILGADVTIASNGQEALDQIKKTYFDIVFMDCQMPTMDGLQATRIIRESFIDDPKKRDIPIVALTAGGDKSERESAMKAGMDFFITKPFTLDDVKAVITAVFENMGIEFPIASDATFKKDETPPSGISLSGSLLDKDSLKGILEIEKKSGRPLLHQLLTGYKAQATQKKDEMLAAILEEDKDKVRKCSHALKSMSANIGALEIRRSYDLIERNYESLSLNDIRDELSHLEEKLDAFYDAIDQWQKNQKSPTTAG